MLRFCLCMEDSYIFGVADDHAKWCTKLVRHVRKERQLEHEQQPRIHVKPAAVNHRRKSHAFTNTGRGGAGGEVLLV